MIVDDEDVWMVLQEKFEIERKHTRSILRVLKRNPLKCSLWQKRTLRKALFIGQLQISPWQLAHNIPPSPLPRPGGVSDREVRDTL